MARIDVLRLKKEVLGHYSPKLKCQNPNCLIIGGCRDIRCLTLDHINGGGSRQRMEVKLRGWRFYEWVKQQNYPTYLQVLCMNCQFIKGQIEYGYTDEFLVNPVVPPTYSELLKNSNKL